MVRVSFGNSRNGGSTIHHCTHLPSLSFFFKAGRGRRPGRLLPPAVRWSQLARIPFIELVPSVRTHSTAAKFRARRRRRGPMWGRFLKLRPRRTCKFNNWLYRAQLLINLTLPVSIQGHNSFVNLTLGFTIFLNIPLFSFYDCHGTLLLPVSFEPLPVAAYTYSWTNQKLIIRGGTFMFSFSTLAAEEDLCWITASS